MTTATTSGSRLGDILLRRGLLDRYQLQCALARQRLSRLPLGEILVAEGFLRPDDLAAALAVQAEERGRWPAPARSRPLLGRLLVEKGLVTESGLQRALLEQRRRGGLLGEILVRRGYITRGQLAAALEEQRRLARGERRAQPRPGGGLPRPVP